jgi:hypothetical protein
MKNATFSLENAMGRDHLEYLGVDWRIILKWMLLVDRVWRCGLDSCGSGRSHC